MRLGMVAACLTLALFAVVALASAQPARGRAATGQILVTFAPSANANAKADAHRVAGGRLLSEIAGRGVALVAVPGGDEAAAIARYRGNPNVLHAEPNYIRSVPEPAANVPSRNAATTRLIVRQCIVRILPGIAMAVPTSNDAVQCRRDGVCG